MEMNWVRCEDHMPEEDGSYIAYASYPNGFSTVGEFSFSKKATSDEFRDMEDDGTLNMEEFKGEFYEDQIDKWGEFAGYDHVNVIA